jgi:hypothetical protein
LLVDDKAGMGAFKLDQARDYARAILGGRASGYDGVVYVFDTLDAADATAQKMSEELTVLFPGRTPPVVLGNLLGTTPGIRVMYIGPHGEPVMVF